MKYVMALMMVLAMSATTAAQTKDGDRGSDSKDDGRNETREESGKTPDNKMSKGGNSGDLNELAINWQHEIDQTEWIAVGSRSSSGDIVLERGYTSSDDIFLWRYNGTAGKKSVSGYKFGTPVTEGWECNAVTGICICTSDDDCMALILATQ